MPSPPAMVGGDALRATPGAWPGPAAGGHDLAVIRDNGYPSTVLPRSSFIWLTVTRRPDARPSSTSDGVGLRRGEVVRDRLRSGGRRTCQDRRWGGAAGRRGVAVLDNFSAHGAGPEPPSDQERPAHGALDRAETPALRPPPLSEARDLKTLCTSMHYSDARADCNQNRNHAPKPSRANNAAAGVSAGQGRKRRDSNPRTLAGLSLSRSERRCSGTVGDPYLLVIAPFDRAANAPEQP